MRATSGSGVARCAEIERSACDRQRRAIFERSARSSAGTGREARARGGAGGPNTHLRPIPSRRASTRPSGGRRRPASTWWRRSAALGDLPELGTRGRKKFVFERRVTRICELHAEKCRLDRHGAHAHAKKTVGFRLTDHDSVSNRVARAGRGGRRGSAPRPGCPARHTKRCARAERACFLRRSPFRTLSRARRPPDWPRVRHPRR